MKTNAMHTLKLDSTSLVYVRRKVDPQCLKFEPKTSPSRQMISQKLRNEWDSITCIYSPHKNFKKLANTHILAGGWPYIFLSCVKWAPQTTLGPTYSPWITLYSCETRWKKNVKMLFFFIYFFLLYNVGISLDYY